jgi:hypothetical protein
MVRSSGGRAGEVLGMWTNGPSRVVGMELEVLCGVLERELERVLLARFSSHVS